MGGSSIGGLICSMFYSAFSTDSNCPIKSSVLNGWTQLAIMHCLHCVMYLGKKLDFSPSFQKVEGSIRKLRFCVQISMCITKNVYVFSKQKKTRWFYRKPPSSSFHCAFVYRTWKTQKLKKFSHYYETLSPILLTSLHNHLVWCIKQNSSQLAQSSCNCLENIILSNQVSIR